MISIKLDWYLLAPLVRLLLWPTVSVRTWPRKERTTDSIRSFLNVFPLSSQYFRTLNTRVSVIYIETWQGMNQADIGAGMDISLALLNLNDYTMRRMFHVPHDTTQLLTYVSRRFVCQAAWHRFWENLSKFHSWTRRGETFSGGESGVAIPSTVCKQKSVGISVDLNTYEPHLLAGTMAHMIGHNIGMSHDDGS